MTKEELEKEADDYAEKHAFRVPYDGSNKFYDDVDYKASREGYIAGAKSRKKRIANLEATNKKISDECHKLVDSLEKKQNENVSLIGKIAFAGNKLNNLEKENAELKKKCQSRCDECWEEHIKLTKAKELLKKAMKNTWSIDCFVVDEINAFLKSEVEK